jgi:hypothetical protein
LFIGLAGWKSAVAGRMAATMAAYALAFMVVGQSFNEYWGLMYIHLMGVGMAYAPASVADLVGTSLGRSAAAEG